MYRFVEKDMKGISYIFRRYSKANNKYMKSCETKPSRLIICMDIRCHNLFQKVNLN